MRANRYTYLNEINLGKSRVREIYKQLIQEL